MSIAEYVKNNNQDTWIEYIVNSLQGSTNDLGTYLDEYKEQGFDEDKLYDEIDNTIFQCTCGWWCDVSEIHEVNDESVCDDCYEEEDEDED